MAVKNSKASFRLRSSTVAFLRCHGKDLKNLILKDRIGIQGT